MHQIYFLCEKWEKSICLLQALRNTEAQNIFNLKICILVYRIKYIKTKIPSVFLDLITSVSEIHCYNTRYSVNHNLYGPSSRTNYGLSRFKAISPRIWEKIPLNLKQLAFKIASKVNTNYIFLTTKTDLLCIYVNKINCYVTKEFNFVCTTCK